MQMYSLIKKTINSFVPWKFMIKHELRLRYLFYQLYRGKNYYCNICHASLRTFIQLKDGEKLCPRCGSLSRNRRLWELLQEEFLKPGMNVLDFSPSRNLFRVLKAEQHISYTSSDYSGEFLADRNYSIVDIDRPDNEFDLIICYHILEHIEEDMKAMSELYRILKPGGVCMIQTPFKEGTVYENPAIYMPEDRLKHFGQADHVRIYSVDGLTTRLRSAGFMVEAKEFIEHEINKLGLKMRECILVGRKN
jgi:SAM-dependent methyltransferase